MVDENSFVLGEWIGTNNSSPSFLPFSGPHTVGDIQVSLLAREVSGTRKSQIANFSFLIDWMDTFYSKPPRWRQLILTDTRAQYGGKVLSVTSLFPTVHHSRVRTEGRVSTSILATHARVYRTTQVVLSVEGKNCDTDLRLPNTTTTTPTTTTPKPSGNSNTKTIVATSVPVTICLLGMVASTSVYFYKRMKGPPVPDSGQRETASEAWVNSSTAADTLATV
ncbi:hypothetical protein ElyMa_001931500 [Elysia marginata]|uniref:Uncharacterized protein n=1 Tax=Elysia marginata TaxID=1093978 RepID=A0AAV4EUA7_9GAST|nr:hypothetical protein ElyMa_001931500 [Elysia marginata]